MASRQLLWTPSSKFIESSNLKQYEDWLRLEKGLYFDDYEALWQWSIDHIEVFWESLCQYFEVIFHSPYRQVLSGSVMPEVKWFEGSTLNYSEHIFRKSSEHHPALIFQNEKERISISWAQLENRVLAFQQFLISKGIKNGDCIAGYLPNIPEAIVAFLAANSIGAIWSCCSPDFGVDTVAERFRQIKPKMLIAADGYQYNGKPYSRIKEVTQIRDRIESLETLVLVNYLDEASTITNSVKWQDIKTSETKLEFTPVPFDHPIWVLYSSGTTGKPKAITHSHGGVLLEHLKYMTFHNDVKEGEHFFWFTTTGWMMWNFLQSSMLAGAVPVIFDGSPGYPSMDVLWKMAEELPLHHFGTSAPYLTACMNKQLEIRKQHDLNSLRSIGSTGAPLPPEVFEWIYKEIKEDLWLCSMSGGTDVCTAFVGGTPYKPVYKSAIQSRALGCALYAYDDRGHHVIGSLGEMMIEKPMPSMPIYFWNDPDMERYRASYFEKYPDHWCHGDWIQIFEDGSLVIHGRSDATLNRKGIRIGTAEIYNVLEQVVGIEDALIINIELPEGGDTMPLFVVLKDNVILDEELKQSINKALKTKCSPRHVPDEIIEVPDIPYTLSGKKMEVPVKKLFMKMTDPNDMNMEAIRNPAAMLHFVEMSK